MKTDSLEVSGHIADDSFANSELNYIDKLTMKLCALLTLFTRKFLSEKKHFLNEDPRKIQRINHIIQNTL